MKSEQGKGRN